ncbi:hypothetical protein OTU49_009906, partial [Cherax quadricarinatus]
DGRWHHAAVSRYGGAVVLSADEGDGDLYNSSLTWLRSPEGSGLLQVDAEGVLVGGAPQHLTLRAFTVHRDYFDGCLDDLRISGRSVPLPPAMNTTSWGDVRGFQGVESGCTGPPACSNVTCSPPLTCVDTWRSYHCGCEGGRVLDSSGATCVEADECFWRPCLNAGSCYNTHPGYMCACPVGFSGQHCQVPEVGEPLLNLSLGALLAIVVWCTFLLLLVGAFLLHQHRRSSLRRGEGEVKGCTPHPLRGHSVATHCTPTPTPNLLEMKMARPPRANDQPAWIRNPNIADVDVLQVDAASVTSSMEDQKRCSASFSTSGGALHADGGLLEVCMSGGSGEGNCIGVDDGGGCRRGGGVEDGSGKRGGGGGGGGCSPAGDDLRNYAYEGEGSSPGSLSSCLESCSGSTKLMDGFREVAHLLESWDPTNSQSVSSSTKTNLKRDTSLPITNILCDVHAAIGPQSKQNQPIREQHRNSDPLDTSIPLPIPDPSCAFMN